MFIKTNEIKNLIIHTSLVTKEEYDFLKEKFNNYTLVFLVTYHESIPTFIKENDLVIKEQSAFLLYGYGSMLKKIVGLTQIPSMNSVMISKSLDFLKHLLSQPIGTILISERITNYNDIGFLPDLKLFSFNELEVLKNRTGHFSEVCSTFLKKGESYGNSGYVLNFIMDRENYKFDVYAGGRYFKSSHECYNTHQLSHRIFKSKNEQSQNQLFKGIFVPIINLILKREKIDGITRVPSRPGKRDRLKPLVQLINNELKLTNYCDELICPQDYPSHKELSSTMRFENVKGNFQVMGQFFGKHLILIDDVFTTGATVFECAKLLYENGAAKVTVVVLGVNQFSNAFTQRKTSCTECNGKMILRMNSWNNTFFYGCENYFNKNNKCEKSEDFVPGWKRINEENCINPENLNDHSEELWF